MRMQHFKGNGHTFWGKQLLSKSVFDSVKGSALNGKHLLPVGAYYLLLKSTTFRIREGWTSGSGAIIIVHTM